MRKAKERGAPRDAARFSKWNEIFSGYRHQVTEGRIERWIAQFSGHEDLASRLLDCVDFISHDQITAAYKSILHGLDGWHLQKKKRKGKWRFVAFSSHAGESGDAMLHQFRVATSLSARYYDELFIHRSELLDADLKEDDTCVFVDDFSGTGDQAVKAWLEQFDELLPGAPNTYLVLVMASKDAVKNISKSTSMVAVPYMTLGDRDYVFSNHCTQFDQAEKEKLLEFCTKADKKNPRGYKDCGFVVVFCHRCPTNTVPVLHADHKDWDALFSRSG